MIGSGNDPKRNAKETTNEAHARARSGHHCDHRTSKAALGERVLWLPGVRLRMLLARRPQRNIASGCARANFVANFVGRSPYRGTRARDRLQR